MHPRQSIGQTFAQVRRSGGIALMPFVTACYPSEAATAAMLPALERAGANLIEIGIPFSDPIADGPVIQESYCSVLGRGLGLDDILAMVRQARGSVSIPLLAMVSFSVVFRRGVERFAREAREAGFDGLILPDLPPPEAQPICKIVRDAGLDTVLLVAPTTPPRRRAQIAELSSGFVYYLSVAGITGERSDLPAGVLENVSQLRSMTDRPVCVGFGISRPEHVSALRGVADGAIVGSGFVRRIRDHSSESPEAIASAVGAYCRDLLSALPANS